MVLTDLDDRSYEPYEATLGVRVRMVARPGPDRAAELERLNHELLRLSAFGQAKLITARLFRPAVSEMFEAARQLCARSDLVIGHSFHHPVRTAAEAAGIPEISVTLSPDLINSSARAPTGIPSLGRLWNRAWWGLADSLVNRTFLADANELRASLGLGPLRTMRDAWCSRLLDLVAVSPTLYRRPADWDPRHQLTGFFTVPAALQVDELPDQVEMFLHEGPPPVFVGFGSLTPQAQKDRDELRQLVESAIARTGRRAIIQGLAVPEASTGTILHVRRAPHARVFPRVVAVVHHGGAGTTQVATQAGTPSVIVPHVSDQFFWGAALHRLGVAARPIARARLTDAGLAARIEEATSTHVRARAREIGTRIASEDGTREALRLMETVLGQAVVGNWNGTSSGNIMV
jgi:UDP:flavonoid glycosyltransferase YjiC (YdhE family)